MSAVMEEEIKRWTARRKSALVLEIIQGKTTVAEAVGKAGFVGEPTRAALKVSFFGPFYGGYNVVALDPNYQWAMVVGSDLDYLWTRSRWSPLACTGSRCTRCWSSVG